MTLREIQDLLKKTSALRSEREAAANFIGPDDDNCRLLLKLAGDSTAELQNRACWVLEIIFLEHPTRLTSLKTEFLTLLKKTAHPSAIRSLVKVTAIWTRTVTKEKTSPYPLLTPGDHKILTDRCFSLLLDDMPVAVKVHSMETLYELGKEIPWIHPELRSLLQSSYPEGSPGFKARARKILKKL